MHRVDMLTEEEVKAFGQMHHQTNDANLFTPSTVPSRSSDRLLPPNPRSP